MPLIDPRQQKLASYISEFVHNKSYREAASLVANGFGIPFKDSGDPKKYEVVLLNYLHVLLEQDAVEEAAQLLWTPNLFSPDPQCTKDVWKLYHESSQGLIMGAGSMSKSFGMGVRLFLEWVRDPEWTSIRLIGPSKDHLEANLFSHMVRLHEQASLPMPGVVGELFIGLSRRNQLSAIKGVIIPVGSGKKAGRIQGIKRQPRPVSHPKFGPLSRLFVFIDEIENVPDGIWSDMDNILSQITKEGFSDGFKIFGAYNPANVGAQVAQRAEPPFGWPAFDVDTHFRWKSIRGWDVLRLDGEKSENVTQGKTIYPGLQTRAGLESIAKNAGGTQSPGYYTMGRGAYPPQGIELALIPPGMFAKWVGEFIWLEAPAACAGCDLALEGGDNAVYSLGVFGKAVGMKLPASLEFPQGQTVMFKDRMGQTVVRSVMQLNKQFTLPKGDTVAMTAKIIDTNKRAAVRPEYFSCDRTGNGAGTADLIKHDWSPAIHDINYMESPSAGKKIMIEDSADCDKEYDRLWTELWYALRALGEFGYFLIAPSVDLTKLQSQVTKRKSRMVGKMRRVESKKDYVIRSGESPGEADSLTLMIHAVRMGTGWTFSMKGEQSQEPGGLPDDDDWGTIRLGRNGVFIDVTARQESLEDRNSSIM